ncbi:MAG: hypothetical protein EBZ59_11400 [Planctomycetia bacterium]|nr:hypothetical protein [Planctomycetia bacterium]
MGGAAGIAVGKEAGCAGIDDAGGGVMAEAGGSSIDGEEVGGANAESPPLNRLTASEYREAAGGRADPAAAPPYDSAARASAMRAAGS